MRTIRVITWVALLVTLCGCTNAALIKGGSTNTRNDVFQVIAGGEKPLPDYSRLTVSCSVKTIRACGFRVGSKDSHAGMTLIVNIDGQMVRVPAVLSREESDTIGTPVSEAGCGIRQSFAVQLQLPAGRHRLIAAIPEEGVAVGEKITLASGTENVLQLRPHYRGEEPSRLGPYTATSFREGIYGLTAVLNGSRI